MADNLPLYGETIVNEGKATLQFHQYLEDLSVLESSTAPVVLEGTGPPLTAPGELGSIYIDTTGEISWSAVGTVDSSDWKQTTGQGGGDLLAANNLNDVTNAETSRTNLNVDVAGTDNSTNVTLIGTGTYLSIAGQAITVDPITESDISDLGNYPVVTGSPVLGDTLVFDGTDWAVNLTQLIKEVDDVGGTTFYIGEAQPGTSTATAAWRVKRIVFTGDDSETLFADGDANFDNTWTGRAGFSYS